MDLSRTVSEINGDFGKKKLFFSRGYLFVAILSIVTVVGLVVTVSIVQRTSAVYAI